MCDHPSRRHRYARSAAQSSTASRHATHTLHPAHDPAASCCRPCSLARTSPRPMSDAGDPEFIDNPASVDMLGMPAGEWVMIGLAVGGMGLAAGWAIWWAGRSGGAW